MSERDGTIKMDARAVGTAMPKGRRHPCRDVRVGRTPLSVDESGNSAHKSRPIGERGEARTARPARDLQTNEFTPGRKDVA